MADSQPWRPRFTNREHPPGEVGINISLDEVAKRAVAGSTHPRVVTWARNTIEAARGRGLPAKTPADRARILLKAVQGKLWIPDPVGAEFIAGAHLLACDDERDGAVCIKAADCDELVVLLAAVFSAVGIYTMIVGHAYDQQRRIEHVLCAAYVDGKWWYADPSTQLPLGKCVTPFSRERLLSMPNVQVLCDERACLSARSFSPDGNNFVNRGVFVGVDGPPTLAGLASPVAWLGEVEQFMWLGQSTIDLKDPATMIEVKRLMSLLRPSYTDTSVTWGPSDWINYSILIDEVAKQSKFNKSGSIAYVEGDKVKTGNPPANATGFPSAIGIQNMGEAIVTRGILSEGQLNSTFVKLRSYSSPVAVTAPNFAAILTKRSGGASSLLLPLLVIGGIGAAIAVSARRDAASSLDT